jgi:DNA-binding NtrC family response regulator
MEAASAFDWPGNIRQLKNVIEASITMENGNYITLPVLSQFIEVSADEVEPVAEEGEYVRALSRFEMDYLKVLLRKNRGNIEAAAREAGMNMATIYRKIKKYNIKKEDYS